MYQTLNIALSTFNIRHAGTHSQPVLIMGDRNRDLLHHTFDLPEGIKEGSSHILSLDVSKYNLPSYLDYVRLGIRGADAWWPEYAFIWGDNLNESGHRELVPLGLENWTPYKLSTDEEEGRISIPINRANLASIYTRMQRMILMIGNESKRYAGTKSPITVKTFIQDNLFTEFTLPEGSLAEDGAVFFNIRYTPEFFTVDQITSVQLEIGGDDKWTPSRFHLFAVDNRVGDNESVYPIVNIRDWSSRGLGALSADPKEGNASVVLYQAYL